MCSPASKNSRQKHIIEVHANLRFTPLEGFQGFADEKAVPWKQANDTVHQRGGWKAYAKEASEAGPATGANSSAGHGHGEGVHTMTSGTSMSMPMAPRKGQP